LNNKHHFIRFLSIEDYYSSSLFERDVLELLPKLFSDNNITLMSGGSGMYIDAVCYGIDDIPDVDPSVRKIHCQILGRGYKRIERNIKNT